MEQTPSENEYRTLMDGAQFVGQGSWSKVYKVTVEGKAFALKSAEHEGRELDDEQRRTFVQEGLLMARLAAQAVPRVHTVSKNSRKPFILMEYIHGHDLSELLAMRPLSETDVCAVLSPIACALGALHALGFVHRDVKSANIRRDQTGRAYLLDFGLATQIGGANSAAGSFYYAAPEQTGMLNVPVDARADLYGLGVVMFEALTGKRPYNSADEGELVRLHAVAPIPELGGNVSGAMASIVHKLLAKDPDDRYQSAASLNADLRDIEHLRQQHATGVSTTLGSFQDNAAKQIFIGRKNEIEVLSRVLEKAKQEPSIAIIEGEPGAGKSALLRELLRQHGDKTFVLKSKSNEGASPFLSVFREAIGEWILNHRADTTALRNKLGSPDFDLVLALIPELAEALKIAPDTAQLINAPPEVRFRALQQVLRAITPEGCLLVFVIDDVQWMDKNSRDALSHLLRSDEDFSSIAILASCRNNPESQGGRAAFFSALTGLSPSVIELAALPNTDVATFISRVLGDYDIEDAVTRQVAGASHGNPFVLREYLGALLQQGIILPRGGQFRLSTTELASLQISNDVVSLLQRRLATLDERQLSVLRIAATIGGTFDTDLLTEITGQTEAEIAQMLGNVRRIGLIDDAESTNRFVFVHDRVRETLQIDMTAENLAHVHQVIADAMERMGSFGIDVLAQHHARGEGNDTERVFSRCVEAATKALRQEGAFSQAYEFLNHAERFSQSKPSLINFEFLILATEIAAEANQLESARRFSALATQHARTDLERAAVFEMTLSKILMKDLNVWDQTSPYIDALRKVRVTVPRSSLLMVLLSVLYLLCARWMIGRRPRLSEENPRSPSRLEELQLRTRLLAVGNNLAYYNSNRPLLLFILARSALEGAISNDIAGRCQACCNLGVFEWAGRPGTGRNFFDRALAEAQASGNPRLIAKTISNIVNNISLSGFPLPKDFRDRLLETVAWLDPHDRIVTLTMMVCISLLRGQAPDPRIYHARDRILASLNLPNEQPTEAYLSGDFLAADKIDQNARRNMRVTPNLPPHLVSHTFRSSVFRLPFLSIQEIDKELAELQDFDAHHLSMATLETGVYAAEVLGRSKLLLDSSFTEQSDHEKIARTRLAIDHLRSASFVPLYHPYAEYGLAAIALQRKDIRRAIKRLKKAEKIAEDTENVMAWLCLERLFSKVLTANGQGEAARACAERALSKARELGWRGIQDDIVREFKLSEASGSPGSSRSSDSTQTNANTVGLRRQLDALLELSKATASVFDVAEQTRLALDSIIRVLRAERGFIFLANAANQLVFETGRNSSASSIDLPKDYATTVVSRVFTSHEALVISASEQGREINSESIVAHELRSIIAAPLMLRDSLFGVVYLDNRLAKGIFSNDDVELLNAMSSHISLSIESARAAKLELEKRDLRKDLEVTAAVQSMLLPKAARFAGEGIDGFGFFRPAAQSGGDWWYHESREDGHWILVGDVTGHGTASAMVTAVVAGAYKLASAGVHDDRPEQTLARINRTLAETCGGQFGMTMSLAIVDHRRGRLTWVNAGAPPIFLCHQNGKVDTVGGASSPLGENLQFLPFVTTMEIRAGDRVFLFTDGFPELRLDNGRMLGMRRLRDLLGKSRSEASPEKASLEIMAELDRRRGSADQDDDMTLVTVDVA